MRIDTSERWKVIPGFSDYLVSSHGKIYSNRSKMEMRPNTNNYGNAKINLISDIDGRTHTLSVAQIVAEAFVEPPNALCNRVAVLDGDFTNLVSWNLVWRPRWFVWKYTNQLKQEQFSHYHSIPVRNEMTGAEYESVVVCGKTEGLLFSDIWMSTFTHEELFPYWHSFEALV